MTQKITIVAGLSTRTFEGDDYSFGKTASGIAYLSNGTDIVWQETIGSGIVQDYEITIANPTNALASIAPDEADASRS